MNPTAQELLDRMAGDEEAARVIWTFLEVEEGWTGPRELLEEAGVELLPLPQ